MINFNYTESGVYDSSKISDLSESLIVDKAHQKLRLFGTEDFYFSVLSDDYVDSSDGSTGLSQKGAYEMHQAINSSLNDITDSIILINDHISKTDTSVNRTNSSIYRLNSSVNRLERKIGDFNFNRNYVYALDNVDSSTSDLDIADSSGNVLVRFSDGHISTAYFDSSDILPMKINIAASNTSIYDISARLTSTNSSVYRINSSVNRLERKIGTFNFNRNYIYALDHVDDSTNTSDLDLADSSGNVLVRFSDGHIQTKEFDSETVNSSIEGLYVALIENEETFSAALNAMNASIAWVDANFGGYYYDIETINSSIDRLDRSVMILDGSISALESSVNSLESHTSISDTSISKINSSVYRLNSSVNRLERKIGTFNFNRNYIYALDNVDSSVSDLDLADSSGNVLVRFADGHIQTAYFDSSDILLMKRNIAASNTSINKNIEDITDISIHLSKTDTSISKINSSVYRLNSSVNRLERKIGTFNFNRNYIYALDSVDDSTYTSELDLADSSGNVLVRFTDGHISSKAFDSSVANASINDLYDMVVDTSALLFAELAENELTFAAALTTMDASVVYIMDSFSGYPDELGEINSSISILNSSVTELEAYTATNDVNISTINTSIDRLNTSVSSLADYAVANDANLISVNSSIDRIDVSVSALESNVAISDTSINDISSRLAALDSQNATNETSITTINSSLNDIETKIGDFDFTMNYIYAVDNVDTSAGVLEIADSSGNALVRFSEGHIQTAYFDSSDILPMKQNIAASNSSIDGLTTSMTDVSALLATLNSSITDILTRLVALEGA